MLPPPSGSQRPGRQRHVGEPVAAVSKQTCRHDFQREATLFGHPLTRGGSADLCSTLTLSVLYLLCSVGLILYNNYLMDYGRFPHPTHLVWVQMVFISCFTALLLLTKPSLFPSLGSPSRAQRMTLDGYLMLRGVLPVAILLAISLVLSTAAYLHSPLVSWQLMREGGVAFTYLFSLYLALDSFSWLKVLVLLGVLGATSLTICGGQSFSAIGFAMQAVAIMCESLRTTLQAKLLTTFRRLDVLTYVLLTMPVCMALLTCVCAAKDIFRLSENFAGPRQLDVVGWGPHLAANGCLAFLVSMLQTCLMEYASPVLFSTIGIAKDTVVVCLAISLVQEAITLPQGLGFCLQVVGIFVYTLIRASPLAVPRKPNVGNDWAEPALTDSKKDDKAEREVPAVMQASPPETTHTNKSPIAKASMSQPSVRQAQRAQV